LQVLQAERAVNVLGDQLVADDYVIRLESIIRLFDASSPRLAEQVQILTSSERHRLAEIVLDTAIEIGANPCVGLVDKVVACITVAISH
jgi:hypothetical protein